MPQYKHLTPEMVARVAEDVDFEIEMQNRLDKVRSWAANPSNAAQLHQIQAALDRVAPQRQPQQRTATSAVAGVQRSNPAPTGYKSRAQLEREKPWLAPRKPELESIIDPYAGRKPNRI
jgi:hypothetical protein